MILNFDGGQPAFALLACRLCGRATYGGSLSDIPVSLVEICGNSVVAEFDPIGAGCPASLRGVGLDGICLAISGLTLASQAAGLFASYGGPAPTADTRFFAGWVATQALRLAYRWNLPGVVSGRDVYLFGHSGGGAIALALAAYLRPLCPQSEIHVVSFGAPRASSSAAFAYVKGVNVARWMNSGDDAPRMPPRIDDCTDLAFLAAVDKFPAWYRWDHVSGGLVLSSEGVVEAKTLPPRNRLLGTTTFPISYLQTGGLFGTPHAIGEYERRLMRALPMDLVEIRKPTVRAFDVAQLPTMFELLRSDIPMSLPIPIYSGVEPHVPPGDVDQEITRREAFIASPLKRC
jgi:pimeloyl-ACP methyl ester carboxylesterase